MTHWDGSSDEACKIYSLMIHYLITEAEKLGGDPGRLRKHLDVLLRPTKYNTYNTDNLLRLGGSGGLESSGYVVDSFKFCPWDSVGYADAICNAANMGGRRHHCSHLRRSGRRPVRVFRPSPRNAASALSAHDRERLDAAAVVAVESRENSMMC